MDEVSLRRQLTAILEKTAGARGLTPGGFWAGDVAGERRVLDDLKVGRLSFLGAHRSAKSGLKAIDDGEKEMAEACLTNAVWSYIDSLEKRTRPQEMQLLLRPARKRGRTRGARSKKVRHTTTK